MNKKSKRSLSNEDKQKELKIAYGMTFNSEHGKQVLRDLLDNCHVFHTSYIPGNSLDSAFREGERNVGLRILDMLNIDDIKAGETSFEASGASYISGDIEISGGIFNISGASVIDLEGYASDISIDASGASHADLASFSASNATVDISGASVANVNASGTIDGDVSGASRLTYLGDPALTIDMSGDSKVDSR